MVVTVIMLSFTSQANKDGRTATFGSNEPASQQQVKAKQAPKISALTYYRVVL